MTRYLKQRDRYSCGPIAILNVLKWAGDKVTYKDLPKIKKECGCKMDRFIVGTYPSSMKPALLNRDSIILSKTVHYPSVSQINNWLKKGNSVILRYSWWYQKKQEWIGHYVSFTGKEGSKYIVHNASRKTSTTKWSRERLRNYLGNHKNNPPQAWFIRRR